MINLDGTIHSTLDWSVQVENQQNILWNLDLGLFDRLPEPLSSTSQYQTLKLSLEHFCNTLWKEFQDQTMGICLYKGSADLSNAEREYLDLLAGYLPEGLDAYVSFDTTTISDPIKKAHLVSKEHFPHFKIIVDGQIGSEASIGILLSANDFEDLYPIYNKLTAEKKAFRFIPESLLTTEWHGLDELYVSERTLTPSGRRKVLGFEAAGGNVIYY